MTDQSVSPIEFNKPYSIGLSDSRLKIEDALGQFFCDILSLGP